MKDDYDAWPAEIKGEGDQENSPTLAPNHSPYEEDHQHLHHHQGRRVPHPAKFMDSSMAFYHIKCPHCGMWQVLLFSDRSVFADMVPHGAWSTTPRTDSNRGGHTTNAGTATVCAERIIEEWRKPGLIRGGAAKWIHLHPERRKHLGYQWNRLVSPFSGWQNIAAEFLAAQGTVTRCRRSSI